MYYTVIKHNRHLRTQQNVENMSQRWVFSTKQYFFLLVFRNGKIDDVVLGFDNLEGELTDHLKNNNMIKEIIENAREVSYSYNKCYSQKLFNDPDICRASSVPIFPIFPIFSQSSYISLYSLQMPYNPYNSIIFKI